MLADALSHRVSSAALGCSQPAPLVAARAGLPSPQPAPRPLQTCWQRQRPTWAAHWTPLPSASTRCDLTAPCRPAAQPQERLCSRALATGARHGASKAACMLQHAAPCACASFRVNQASVPPIARLTASSVAGKHSPRRPAFLLSWANTVYSHCVFTLCIHTVNSHAALAALRAQVRDVAPNKLMLCLSFRLPAEIALKGRA